MKQTLWQIAIAIRAVYGVNLTAHSNEAPHGQKLWGYHYVDYPIANTYEADRMSDSHSCQSSVWSELYGTQQQSTPQQKLWGYPYVDYPIANTYEADPMADSSVWIEPYGTQQRSTPQQKTMGLSLRRLPHSKHL